MPATITHAYFGKDLYQLLDKHTKEFLKKEQKSLMMFSQNTDPFMFYNILSIKKGKKIRSLQYTSHTKNTDLLFQNLIQFMKNKKYYQDPKTLSFLYGMICHYTLDSEVHPFIVYKTGLFQKNKKDTYKYRGLHNHMESYIDHYMLQKHKKNSIDFKDFCFDLSPFSQKLKQTIAYTFESTFQVKNMDKIYYTSLKQMETFLTLFRLDQYGHKRKLYKWIDIFTPKNSFPLESISYYIDPKDKKDYLNKEHKLWNYPIDKNITSHKSFDELYSTALKKAEIIIKEINQYFYQNKPINIHKLFENKSYLTGVNCDIEKEQKFFEF